MEGKRINIADILRYVPKGTRLYSPVCGYVELLEIDKFDRIACNPPEVRTPKPTFLFNADGTAYLGEREVKMKGECMLFPSHICRSWNAFYFRSGEYVSIDFYYSYGEKLTYVILYRESYASIRIDAYAALNVNGKTFRTDWQSDFLPMAFEEREMVVRPASDDEIKMFNGAMDKAGYVWNAETKELSKHSRFKPFDKVVARDNYDHKWQCDFFSHFDKDSDDADCVICVGGLYYEVLPYNEETAKLVGTTDNWEC